MSSTYTIDNDVGECPYRELVGLTLSESECKIMGKEERAHSKMLELQNLIQNAELTSFKVGYVVMVSFHFLMVIFPHDSSMKLLVKETLPVER